MARIMLALSAVVSLGLFGCSMRSNATIAVPEETQSQADKIGFDYQSVLAHAEQGTENAISDLMEFSAKTDAAGVLGHGVVLVELIGKVGDRRFAEVATKQAGKVKEAVAESLRAGEAYIQPPLAGLRNIGYASIVGG